MQITPISCNGYYQNKTVSKNTSGVSNVFFSGTKQRLIAVATEDFKTETAKKLYSSIHSILQKVGDSGNINDVKIFNENLEFYNKKTSQKFTTNVDTLLSIKKDSDKAILQLLRQYPSKFKHCVFEAELDKDGQMVNGTYLLGHLKFERKNDNIRRMKIGEITLLPHGDNDRDWGISPAILPVLQGYDDNSTRGMYEIFIELARLYTTLYK